MKLERLHITAFAFIAATIWWVVLLLRGTPVSWDHAIPFTIVVSGLVVVGILLEHVFWYQPWLHGWFVKRPDLRGTWRVELQSSYIRPIECPQNGCSEKLENGERIPKIICYMGVRQTLSTLQMHLMTPESESVLVADRICPSPNGNGYQIIGVYTNEPEIQLRDDRVSEMHQGAFIAETHGPVLHPKTMTAKYWTDRKTIGSMDFTDRTNQIFTRFKDADRNFSSST